MLALTQSAADAVEAMVAQPEVPESAVLRISSQASQTESGEPATELQLMLAEEPEENDVLMEGIAISVDPETLPFLDDKIIDAEIEGTDVRFSLFLQPQAASSNGSDPAAGEDHSGHSH